MKIKLYIILSFFIYAVLQNIIFGQGKVKTPSFITDNMVLQQNFDAPLWGWAEQGTKVTIQPSWHKTNYQTSADYNGNWFVTVKTPSAGGPYQIAINDDTLKNVLIGEVWL